MNDSCSSHFSGERETVITLPSWTGPIAPLIASSSIKQGGPVRWSPKPLSTLTIMSLELLASLIRP